MRFAILLCLACALIALAEPPQPTPVRPRGYRLEIVDVPSSASALNDNGVIAGILEEGRGFLRDPDGTMRFIDLPSRVAGGLSLNNHEQIAGALLDEDHVRRIFVRGPTGQIAIRAIPASDNPPSAAVNDFGHIATSAFGNLALLERDPDRPIRTYPVGSPYLSVSGLNNRGQVTGSFLVPCFGVCYSGFLRNPDGTVEDVARAPATGLNNIGQLVATPQFGIPLVRDPDGTYVYFAVPDAPSTYLRAINSAGTILGSYNDGNTSRVFLASPCQVRVDGTPRSHGSGAESGVLDVSADPDCVWAASGGSSFVRLSSDNVQRGRGSVFYDVATNSATGTPRTDSLNIAGQIVKVTQAGAPCSYVVNRTSFNFGPAGGSGELTVNTLAGCEWSAQNNVQWITMLGSGSNQYAFAVAPNPGPTSRSGAIAIADFSITITQAAAAFCTYVVSSPSLSVAPQGGEISVTIGAGETCAWSAVSANDWITVTAGSAGTGPGEVRLRVAANASPAGRTGSVTVGDTKIDVSQPLSTLMPAAALISPSEGSGGAAAFRFRIADSRGPGNILRVQVLINSVQRGDRACLIYFDVDSRRLQLRDDAGTGWLTASQNGQIENSQCVLDGGQSYSTVENGALIVNVSLTFKDVFSGLKAIFAEALNKDAVSSGYRNVGSFRVVPPLSAGVVGSGASGIFDVSAYVDSSHADVSRIQVLFGDSANPEGVCLASYEQQGGQIRLMNDAGTEFLGPIALGAEERLANNQCIVDAGRSRPLHGDRTETIELAITFLPSFAGRKRAFAEAFYTSGANTGFREIGAWTVLADEAPSLVVTPDSADSRTAAFRFRFPANSGWAEAANIRIEMPGLAVGANELTCGVIYRHADRTVLWTAAAFSPLPLGFPAIVDGSACAIDLSHSSATVDDGALVLTLAFRFTRAELRTIHAWIESRFFRFGFYGP